MSFESFYGGRIGASFVIVEHFDGIDIPENTAYKVKYYAWNGTNFIAQNGALIEKTNENYWQYEWKDQLLNGTTVQAKQGDLLISITLDEEYAKGMVQCFAKGGESTNKVNYGEYVIIDTVNKNNPDNGKVYRRGMNYQVSEDNPLAGAEYIGQIVGPCGETPNIAMDTVNNILQQSGKENPEEYTIDNESLIPGKDGDNFNDAIKYAWYNMKDQYNNMITAIIGFTFPYLVIEIVGGTRSPYYQAGDNIPQGASKEIGDLIEDVDGFNLSERDDDMEHPFYNRWKINTLNGIKGDSLNDFIILPTKVRVNKKMYEDVQLTIERSNLTAGREITIINTYNSQYNSIGISDPQRGGFVGYINANDGYDFKVYDQYIDYNTKESGTIGEYNQVTDFKDLEEIIFDYDAEHPEDGDKKFKILYSNEQNPKVISPAINYVIETKVVIPSDASTSDQKRFLHHLMILYSDPALRSSQGTTEQWYSNVLGKSLSGWVDAGDAGEIRGINILATYSTASDIPANPPETIGGNQKYIGWALLVGNATAGFNIYIYNYTNNTWENGGTYGSGATSPAAFITDADIYNSESAFNSLLQLGFYVNHTQNRIIAH